MSFNVGKVAIILFEPSSNGPSEEVVHLSCRTAEKLQKLRFSLHLKTRTFIHQCSGVPPTPFLWLHLFPAPEGAPWRKNIRQKWSVLRSVQVELAQSFPYRQTGARR